MRIRSLFLKTTVCRAALVCGMMLSAGSIASADDAYTIKLRLVPGVKWTFDVHSTMKQKGQVTTNGQVAQPIDQAMEQHRKGTVEILAVDGGMASEMRVTYDDESSTSGNNNGQAAPAFTLAGKTITLTKRDGNVTNDLKEQPDEQTLTELKQMIEPETIIYPKEPVAVDQSWDGNTAPLIKQFQLSPDDKATVKCKLMGVKDVDGRQIGDIAVTAQIVKHDQGFIETRTIMGGVSHVDLQTGQAIAADIIGKMTSRGQKQINGNDGNPVALAVTADGEIQVHQLVKLISYGDAQAPQAAGNPVPVPMPDTPHPRNPLQKAPAFAGIFKGDQMSLNLAPDNDRFTGTLTFTGKTFPVTAHADGPTLAGTFEADGTPFNFTASLDGATLTLVSDGTTYTLKKAVNPLAQPAPRNPLAQ